MNIVFMGTAGFGIPGLRLLVEAGYSISAVVTNVDMPAGRGQEIKYSPVKQFALERQLPILQPASLKDPAFIEQLTALEADIFIVVAFRILPKEVFTIPRQGTFNLHASLLPKYRGAAPIQWAIINGETETGVTTFFLDEKVDTGNIILQARCPIKTDETTGELHDRLSEIGAEIILHTVRLIEMGKAQRLPQDSSLASPAPKIFKEHCHIDWKKSAEQVHNLVRGLSPVPCAFTSHKGKTLKIFRTQIIPEGRTTLPGEVLSTQPELIVSTGNGAIKILDVQQEGKKRMQVKDFLLGYRISAGEQFE